MFKPQPPTQNPALEEAITEALEDLKGLEPSSLQYATTVDQIERLYALRAPEKERKGITPDALLAVGGNLAGILLILNFERLSIVTSKSLGFVGKFRL